MTGALHALGHLAAVVVRPITPAHLLRQLSATRELDQAVRDARLLGRRSCGVHKDAADPYVPSGGAKG